MRSVSYSIIALILLISKPIIAQDFMSLDALRQEQIGKIRGLAGRIWMDRNLGATRVATHTGDTESYGYIYQWGRNSDGHQFRNSTTTTIDLNDDVTQWAVTPGTEGDKFVLNITFPYDWITPQDDKRWNSGTEESPVKGPHDPCPDGYRLPTHTEWRAELDAWVEKERIDNGYPDTPEGLILAGKKAKNLTYGFNVLALSGIGGRLNHTGEIHSMETSATYWCSSPAEGDGSTFLCVFFALLDGEYPNASMTHDVRSYGAAIRCTKED
ncbi:FISUMP domain-containing protein [Flavivirga spongiicola]|uniref:Fibrobacter succinogenes major paralogous domain-containing protein n=1 Tax=Flavivirga spongiicola TaxID=421621 RepID=A0ABU7Y0Y3_9FLAO|nr:FISUMP domain-containing protein [Flavivirga sp. MEBiC05379]MDO5980794.1 FISUMP domain-containing protein [Flavivirga sp. MEBiC05379]